MKRCEAREHHAPSIRYRDRRRHHHWNGSGPARRAATSARRSLRKGKGKRTKGKGKGRKGREGTATDLRAAGYTRRRAEDCAADRRLRDDADSRRSPTRSWYSAHAAGERSDLHDEADRAAGLP